MVLVDGVRVASAVTGGSPLHLLPPEQIERIEIVRGPVSGIYGADAIGGVIQIFTKQHGKGLSASAGFGSDGQQVYRLSAAGTIGERTRYALTLAQRETGFSRPQRAATAIAITPMKTVAAAKAYRWHCNINSMVVMNWPAGAANS